ECEVWQETALLTLRPAGEEPLPVEIWSGREVRRQSGSPGPDRRPPADGRPDLRGYQQEPCQCPLAAPARRGKSPAMALTLAAASRKTVPSVGQAAAARLGSIRPASGGGARTPRTPS